MIAVSYRDDLGLRLTQHFWLGEFACMCGRSDGYFCGGAVLSAGVYKLVVPLEKLRRLVGPIIIESGCRCRAHHEAIYQGINTKRVNMGLAPVKIPNSSHLKGLGADIFPTHTTISKDDDSRDMLIGMGFKGVGWNMGESRNKIHLDVMDRGKNNLAEWDYAS